MSEIRPPRRRVAGERSRLRRGEPEQPDESRSAVPVEAEERSPVTAPTITDGHRVDLSKGDRPEPPVSPTVGERAPRWPYVVAGVLAVLLVTGIAAAGVLFFRVQDAKAASAARSEAVAAARSHAQAILSYDYRTLDADFARASKALTGTFKKDYASTTSTVVRPSAGQYHVVVKADVTAASVVQASAHRAVVLLYVDQTTTSTRLEGPKVDLNRVRMTLVEQDGKWLVSAVDAL
jgi:Mce-associated membrane protein